ncbi:MAG: hypothetical protein RDU20_10710 [Desulfomonilaceae bacterium]|nr:hypothetical protein [Desulfomonilaceae bacterium]
MDKPASLAVVHSASHGLVGSDFDMNTEVKTTAWDSKEPNLIGNHPVAKHVADTAAEQMKERDRLLRSVLKRFDQVLTPPVPADVEQYIRSKDQRNWLPWETEVIAKVGCWRAQWQEIGPELMEELCKAVRAVRNS